ncbi:MAG: metallophosphoesterase, partial [Eubacteriales bacterium]|nr:metallophosphoesterase [Eubacteriales bacterium]
MKILLLADEECKALYDYYQPGRLDGYDLILAAGDLKGNYLSFIVTMAGKPLVYVHGNHDTNHDVKPPEGCVCADDRVVVRKGVRILGLGGSAKYSNGKYQYTEEQMEKRIKRLDREIMKVGGIDIVLTHAAPAGYGDDNDYCHRGFEAFLPLLDKYKPVYLVHGHIHLNYG